MNDSASIYKLDRPTIALPIFSFTSIHVSVGDQISPIGQLDTLASAQRYVCIVVTCICRIRKTKGADIISDNYVFGKGVRTDGRKDKRTDTHLKKKKTKKEILPV